MFIQFRGTKFGVLSKFSILSLFTIASLVLTPNSAFAFTGAFTATTTVANATAQTVPAITFAGGVTGVTNTVPAITFAGGADVVTNTVPAITFGGGANVVTNTVPAITFAGGADIVNATVPAVAFAGGADETKATRTLLVNALPAAGETITVGTCIVTFADAGDDVDEVNCTDDAATISRSTNPATPRTAGNIAVVLQSLTNVSDTGHGALTVGAPDGTHVSFTTTGAESSATAITFNDGTTADVSSSASTVGVVLTAATATSIIPAGLPASATDHSITIDGVVIDLGTSALTDVQIASAIVATSFAGGTSYLADGAYTVTNAGGTSATLTFTRTIAGVAGNPDLVLGDASYTQTEAIQATATSIIPAGLPASATDHSITIDGVVIDLGTSALTDVQIASAIVATSFAGGTSYLADGAYTVTNAGGTSATLTFTRTVAGAAGNAGVTVNDGDYTTTNAVAATATSLIPAGLAASATDQSVTIDGVTIALGNTAKTAVEIAATIAAADFSGGASYGTGYTVANGGTATLTFTRTVAGAAGNAGVTVNDGDFTTTNAVAATASSIIPAGIIANAGDASITIDGVVINLGTSALTATQIATAIAGTNFTTGTSYLANGAYTVANAGGTSETLTFTRSATGAGGNNGLTLADSSYGLTAQQTTFTPASPTDGETYRATINASSSIDYTVVGTKTVQEVVEGIVTAMNAEPLVSCSEDNLKVTCIADSAGTAFTFTADVVDTTPPTVVITDNEAGIANIAGGDVEFTFTFSEAVTGFATGDVVVAGGAKGTFTADSGTVYRLLVTPTSASTANITVDVAGSVAIDANGNNNTAATQAVQAVDTLRPTLSTVTMSSNNASTTRAKVGDTITLSLTSSETVGTPTVTIDGNSASVSGATTNWTATYTMLSGDTEGTLPFTVDFTDLNTNAGVQVTTLTTGNGVIFDKTAPVIGRVGDSPEDVAFKSTYTDKGATSTDNIDGTLTSSVVTVNPVDTAIMGLYTVTYNVTDSAGNQATEVTRTVEVRKIVASGSGGGGGGSNNNSKDEPTNQVTPEASTAPTSPSPKPENADTSNNSVFTRELSSGASGDDVMELQRRLTTAGVYSGPIIGIFGPLTLAAVKEYQLSLGINPTGYVGPLTLAQLNSGVPTIAVAQEATPITNAERENMVRSLKSQLASLIQQLVESLKAELINSQQ